MCACYCHDKLEKCLKYFLKGVLQDSNSTQLKKQLMHNIPSGNKLPVIKAVAKLSKAPNWMKKKRERNKRRPWLLLRGWGFYNRYERAQSETEASGRVQTEPLVNWTTPCEGMGRSEGRTRSQTPGKWVRRTRDRETHVDKMTGFYRNQSSWGKGSPAQILTGEVQSRGGGAGAGVC